MQETKNTIFNSLNSPSQSFTNPYDFWIVENVLPQNILTSVTELPWDAPELKGVSGTREINNSSRRYFDVNNRNTYSACNQICESFQSAEIIELIETKFNTTLKDCYLRIEYAQDTEDFWLAPHTDIGVKLFTMLLYISDNPEHSSLGTDYYADAKTHSGTVPFKANSAMIFIPSNNTWHGFEKRTIKGIRKSLVINYVTNDWRAREQLCFPEKMINPSV